MSPPPSISVIITAFNRREFLARAISSAASQTLDRSKYEIIVVKNFSTPELDSLIKTSGVVSLERGNEIVGSYIAAGIDQSRGEILVFLDDDDEFVEEKLEKVLKVFSSDPDVGYYHNGIIPIDASGKEIETDFRRRSRIYLESTGLLRIRKPLGGDGSNKLLMSAAYGYLSSIAIRRSVIAPYLDYLRRSIESVQDIFAFYCALLCPRCSTILVDPLKLTRYRMHGANVSLFGGSNLKENEAKITKFLEREKRSLEAILRMSESTANSIQDKRTLRTVRKMIGYELYSRKVDLNMVDLSSNRRRVLSDGFRFFKYSFRSRFLTSQVTVLVRCFLWVLAPTATKRQFVRRHSI